MSLIPRLAAVREHARCHRYRDLDIELRRFEAELLRLERDLEACRAHVPASVTVTAMEAPVSNTYPFGTNPKFKAAVANAEAAPLPGTPVSWSATSGTLVADPTDPDAVQLTNAAVGDVTVTATAANGVAGSDTVTIVDNTPASVTVTDSAS